MASTARVRRRKRRGSNDRLLADAQAKAYRHVAVWLALLLATAALVVKENMPSWVTILAYAAAAGIFSFTLNHFREKYVRMRMERARRRRQLVPDKPLPAEQPVAEP